MKYLISLLFTLLVSSDLHKESVSTVDMVEVINENIAEARHYYLHNWKILREQAIEKGYIESYQFIEMEPTETVPLSFMLITTYKDIDQYNQAEGHFIELIEAKGSLDLLNDKKPNEFRRTIYSKGPLKSIAHKQ
ncbi:hypothetical protein [Roseivirga sp.]|uniref:hypothetical protein n=1 Tax=Roseivirga sp. TaxID=1964215 RepID=UPI003B52AB97